MLTKSNVLRTIITFPDKFSIDELVDKMILLDKIDKGLIQANNNQVVSDEELDKEIEGWLK